MPKWWKQKEVILIPGKGYVYPDRWFSPINNYIEPVRATMNLPKKVKIEDDTLREGVEAPHGLWRRQEHEVRVKVAKALEDAGIEEIQVGNVAGDPYAQTLVKSLQDDTPDLKLVAHVSADKTNIDATVDKGVVMGWMLFDVTAPERWGARTDKESNTIADLCDRITMGVEYAKERGMYIRAGISSPARAPLNRAIPVWQAAYDAGADGTTCMDGQGASSPETIKFLAGIARSIFPWPKDIEIHAHNDFGLGTANCAAFVTGGGNVVDCAVNGLGDRGGQGDLCEIVPILEIIYGVDTGVDMTKLLGLSKLVEELYGIKVQKNHAITGENMYVHEDSGHMASIFRAGREFWGFNIINPEYLGAKEYLHWGGSSLVKGPQSCTALKIGSMGLTYTEKQFDEIIDRITEVAMRKRYATEEEVEEIIRDIIRG